MQRSATVSARPLARAGLELLALTGAAVAQPILDEFGRAPEVFVGAGAETVAIVAFALIVALLPPLALLVAESLVAVTLGERWRARLHAVLGAALAALFLVRALRLTTGLREGALLGVAIVAAAGLAGALIAIRGLRPWLAFASPLPAAAVALFLLSSPVQGVIAASGSGPRSLPGGSVPRDAPSVVMVVLDELPVASLLDANGQLDRARYPGFAALADGSVWYPNTTTVADHTVYSVPAILTGRYPRAGTRAPTWSEYPDNVLRLLGGAYAMQVSEVVTRLCSDTYCSPDGPAAGRGRAPRRPATGPSGSAALRDLLTLARQEYRALVSLTDRDTIAPAVDLGGNAGAPARPERAPRAVSGPSRTSVVNPFTRMPAVQTARFDAFLDQIRAGERRTFRFTHLLLPHGPWTWLPDGTSIPLPPERYQVPGWDRGNWIDDAALVELERRRQLLQVGYVDRLIGELVARLRRTGEWDRSIVVVAADHGAAFTPGEPFRRLTAANAPEILGVPLFVRAPKLRPGVDTRLAQTVDIVPTIADLLGVRVPWPLDGRSLVGAPGPARRAHIVARSGDFGGRASPTVVPVDDLPRRLRALASARALRPPGDDPVDSLLASGPRGDWLGRRVTRGAGRRADARLTIDWPSRRDLEAPTRTGDPKPLYVTGTTRGLSVGDVLVLAVDGRVAAVTSVARYDDALRVAAVLDPKFVPAGARRVRAFVAPPGAGATDVDSLVEVALA